MGKYPMKLFMLLGDSPYTNNVATYNGDDTAKKAAVDSTQADMERHHYEQKVANPYWRRMIAAVDNFYDLPDDHEWGGDNWDHTIAQANSQISIGASNQAEVDNHWDVGNKASIAYSARNPANTDAEAVAEIPSGSDESVADNYPVRYFRQGFDVGGNVVESNPHVEFFAIDCLSHRDPLVTVDDGDIDNPSKTMLGVNQRDWLKKYVVESTAKFIIIVTTKKLYANPGGDNGDIWSYYPSERDHILKHFQTTNDVTGLLWLTGDRHFPNIMVQDTDDEDDYDVLCVDAAPGGVINNGTDSVVDSVTRWRINHDRHVFGLVKVEETYLEASVCDLNNGAKLWTGRVEEGSNKLSYPSKSMRQQVSGVVV